MVRVKSSCLRIARSDNDTTIMKGAPELEFKEVKAQREDGMERQEKIPARGLEVWWEKKRGSLEGHSSVYCVSAVVRGVVTKGSFSFANCRLRPSPPGVFSYAYQRR